MTFKTVKNNICLY